MEIKNPIDDLELVICRVEELLDAQRDYFANKGNVRLEKCKAKERDLSALLKRMRSKGYNPDRFKPNTKQGNLL